MRTQPSQGVVVAHADMLTDDTPLATAVDGHEVVVVRDGDTVRAYGGRCPHRGTSLAEGEIVDGTLVCPGHGWRFAVATGTNVDPSLPCLHPVATRVEHDHVIVDPASLPAAADDPTHAARSLGELPGPRRLPLLGNAAQLDRARLHEILEAWQGTYGAAYRIALGRQQVLVTGDPHLVRDALRRRPGDFRRLSAIAAVLAENNQIGVFAAEGDDWRRQRAMVARALDARHVRGFLPTLLRITSRLRRRWNAAARSGAVVDLRGDLMRYTVDVTAGLVFGHDIDTISSGGDDVIQRHLAHMLSTLNERMMSPVPYWRVIRLPADRRFDAAFEAVRAYCQVRIAESRSRLATEPERTLHPTNLLEALIAATTDEQDPLTEDELIANMLTVLVAGEDTTANTIAWAVHLLTSSPDVRGRLLEEVTAVDGDELGMACRDAGRLPYTDAVVAETMRLKPVAPVILLETNRDLVLGDIALPAGTGVSLLTRPAGLDAATVDTPHDFRPERWLAAARSSIDWRADLVPFGAGPRYCPGRGLALTETRLVLSMLYRNFDVEPVGPPDAVRERFAFAMEPTDIRVRLHRRPGGDGRSSGGAVTGVEP